MNNKQRVLKTLSDNAVLPIIAAPMFLVSSPELVTACCSNGVIGSFPAPNARTIEQLEEWMIHITTSLKEHSAIGKTAPWALNMVTHRTYIRLDEEVELIKRYQPPIVITALGSPLTVIEAVHSYDGLVFADVNSVKFAKKAAGTGVDGLILVSSGAGGHTGRMNSFAFVEAVRQFFDGIIILAGGISTGNGILAAQSLGADLAYMGTSFISAKESMAQSEYKDMVVDSDYDDILMTDAFTGVHANMLRPSIERAGLDPDNLVPKAQIDFSDPQAGTKAWKNIWSAGHGIESITHIQSAADIIKQLHREYEQAQQQLIDNNPWSIVKEEVK
ncbi:nitronate monooxygenase [Sporosarcina sp. P21c]|uniref:NAD(P)H-dependent flavin oxidoreductase n=1 Tax=Sporosarcina sp. P21c TaxID=2048255 RepID=UPI000C173A82|nr:nitronate monooxygenase [Sporosarcina sp. P21c]PIC89118.1 nitronate monooxygenase [Sporosarcina sp. P21c]